MATQTSAATASHTTSARLEDQAATAALYVTKHERNRSSNGNQYMDGDRLSSAGMTLPSLLVKISWLTLWKGGAASLRYASPKDLPSFPSTGLRKDDSAAGAAASLGWVKQTPFEHWKPDPSSAASKAAMLAKDYKAPELWQPGKTASGAQAAALAVKDGGKVEIWKPEVSAWSSSAANQAFKAERNGGSNRSTDYTYTAVGRQGSLMAATGAMSGSRKRSDSTPEPKPTYPDEANANLNALSAATHANNPSKKSRTEYSAISGASPFTNMPKEMFTSHPPVALEVDEKRRSDILHASAVAMAKQMYSMQQKQIDQATDTQRNLGQDAAISAHGRQQPSSSKNDETQPMRFTSLQEAAQRLAQQRLAKLHDEHARNREYRDYYGEDSRPTSTLSIRGRVRRRASSDGTLDEDKEQSQRIRAQMSLFSSSLSQVDETKRQKDREALMAIAQRNVRASLHGMDERVFKETGKVSPSMLNEWEVKAHAAAQKKSDSRMENYGKINIGGGKFVDQSTVDAAAARNVQPILDEINAKAEKERVRQAELKLDQEANKRSAEALKFREKEVREINKKLKEQDRDEERLRKEEEKAAKAQQKRTAKQERLKSKEAIAVERSADVEPDRVADGTEVASPILGTEAVETVHPTEARETPDLKQTSFEKATVRKSTRDADTNKAPQGYIAPTGLRTSMEMQTEPRLNEIIHEGESSPTSPDGPKGVKGWLKTRLRRQSRTQKSELRDKKNDTEIIAGTAEAGDDKKGVDSNVFAAKDTTPELRKSSTEDVAFEGPSTENEERNETVSEERTGRSKRRASSVSSVSALEESPNLGMEASKDDEYEEARDHFDNDLVPPPTFPAAKSASPIRDSKFHEDV